MINNKLSTKRITALLCVMVFTLGLVLSGCQLDKTESVSNTTTNPETTTQEAVFDYLDVTDPSGGIMCPSCGSTNVDEAVSTNSQYDEHYICHDCNCEWYVEDGTAYQIADEGKTVVITTKKATTTKRPNGSANNPSKNPGANKVTSTTTKTTSTTTKKSGMTWDDAKVLGRFLLTGEWLKYIDWYIDEDGNITTKGDKGVLGFGYSTSEKCFYATNNGWQRNFGYNELYDKTSQSIAISYDTINIYFPYEDKNWMIQLWKGQYGLILLGAEVGVYNRDKDAPSSTHFNCVKDEERLPIGLTLRQEGKSSPLFVRKQKDSWWMTGFVPGQLGAGVAVGSSELKKLSATTTITFKDAQMTKAFEYGLKAVKFIYNNVDAMNMEVDRPGYRNYSFKKGDGYTPGTYEVDGNTVTLTWK